MAFTDYFNSYNGLINNSQPDTGLTLAAFGSLANWSSTGAHAVHAVDRSGAGDWVPMLFGGGNGYYPSDVISLIAPLAVNDAGTLYRISFEGAATTYMAEAEGNQFPDHLNFAVTRGDGSAVASLDYTPSWTGASVNPFTPGGFGLIGVAARRRQTMLA